MPVSVRRNPFGTGSPPVPPKAKPVGPVLRTLQARVLAVLVPPDPSCPRIDWPCVNRAQLAIRAGYTTLSGSVTRALNGIRPGNTTSGDPHEGLLGLGFVEEVTLDIEGVSEVNYIATTAGVSAYQEYIAAKGGLPKARDKEASINNRYRRESEQNPERS